jgi:hypothetical protein
MKNKQKDSKLHSKKGHHIREKNDGVANTETF